MVVFQVAKPIALKFCSSVDFIRRRNTWIFLTAVAFLSPNFWMYALVAAPAMFWAGRRDSNPVALYLILLHVVPPIPIPIPMPGVNELFDMDNYRLLALCVLIPPALKMRRTEVSGTK